MGSTHRSKWPAGVAAAVLAVSSPSHGLAAPPPPPVDAGHEEGAIALFREGTRAYEEGRFQDAIDLLLRAYALRQEPVLLFNLARAYEATGDLSKAVESYSRYLASDPDATDRKSVAQRIAVLRKQIADRAMLEDQRDEERRAAEHARRASEDAQKRSQASFLTLANIAPWILAGTGVAGVAAGAAFGVLARSRYEDAVNEPFKGPAEAKYASAQSDATIANVAFVAGGVLGAAGIAWGLLELRARRHDGPQGTAAFGASITLGWETIGVAGRF